MVRLPKTSTLVAIAGGFGIGIGVMTLLLDKERDKWANREPSFIAKALDLINQEPQVKQLLGDKVEIGKTTFNDGWGRLTSDHVQLKVPLKGEHDNAYLFAYARKKDEKSKFRLYKLEATFAKIEGKKLIIYDRTNEPDEVEEEQKKPEEQKESEKKAEAADTAPTGANAENKQQQAGACEKKDRKQLDKEIMKGWK